MERRHESDVRSSLARIKELVDEASSVVVHDDVDLLFVAGLAKEMRALASHIDTATREDMGS